MSTPIVSGWYEIRIMEEISENSLTWFEDFTITRTTSGETVLTGVLADQSALHGLLGKIRDLNLTLISVNQVEKNDRSSCQVRN